tara:strand:+ start:336 stop:488 length:153 start_codon:yes stop_codon:yes gene_type:complete
MTKIIVTNGTRSLRLIDLGEKYLKFDTIRRPAINVTTPRPIAGKSPEYNS